MKEKDYYLITTHTGLKFGVIAENVQEAREVATAVICERYNKKLKIYNTEIIPMYHKNRFIRKEN